MPNLYKFIDPIYIALINVTNIVTETLILIGVQSSFCIVIS